MPKLLSVGQWASLAIARPDLQRRRPWRGLWDRIQEADRLLYAEIAERRADPHVAERTDVLAMLVRATDERRAGCGGGERIGAPTGRAATAGAWQTSGRLPAARIAASAADNRSIVPSPARHNAPRTVAIRAGQGGRGQDTKGG